MEEIHTPSWERSSSERTVEAEEKTRIPYLSKIREHASSLEGTVIESEIVTYDDKFGYIFRYKTVDFIEDDGSFHPEDGNKGKIYKCEGRLIASTKDGENIYSLCGSNYELPKLNNKKF